MVAQINDPTLSEWKKEKGKSENPAPARFRKPLRFCRDKSANGVAERWT